MPIPDPGMGALEEYRRRFAPALCGLYRLHASSCDHGAVHQSVQLIRKETAEPSRHDEWLTRTGGGI